jgi:hypothetical protein
MSYFKFAVFWVVVHVVWRLTVPVIRPMTMEPAGVSKSRLTSTSLQGATTQKTAIFIFVAVRT